MNLSIRWTDTVTTWRKATDLLEPLSLPLNTSTSPTAWTGGPREPLPLSRIRASAALAGPSLRYVQSWLLKYEQQNSGWNCANYAHITQITKIVINFKVPFTTMTNDKCAQFMLFFAWAQNDPFNNEPRVFVLGQVVAVIRGNGGKKIKKSIKFKKRKICVKRHVIFALNPYASIFTHFEYLAHIWVAQFAQKNNV